MSARRVAVEFTEKEAQTVATVLAYQHAGEYDGGPLGGSAADVSAAVRAEAKVRAAMETPRGPGAKPRCPEHPHVELRCPACAGSKGGKATTPKKRRASRRNLRAAD